MKKSIIFILSMSCLLNAMNSYGPGSNQCDTKIPKDLRPYECDNKTFSTVTTVPSYSSSGLDASLCTRSAMAGGWAPVWCRELANSVDPNSPPDLSNPEVARAIIAAS